MHRVSELGIAAHWRYKEGGKADQGLRRQARLGAPAHGLAARRGRCDRVRRGSQARPFPGPGLRLHAEGRRQGPARGLDATRLCLSHSHRRRPLVHRREDQQPTRAARLQAQERRHRRDRHDQGRPRSVARLAEDRRHEPCQGKDPAVVQAPGARREHRPWPRLARARAASPGANEHREAGPGPHRGNGRAIPLPIGRGLLRRDRLRRRLRAAGCHAARDRRRRRRSESCPRSRRHRRLERTASGSRAWAI